MMDKRTGRPTPLASLVQHYEDATLRITHQVVEEWAAKFAARRRKGYERGDFRGGMMFPLSSEREMAALTKQPGKLTELDKFCQYYGLDEEDDLMIYEQVPVEVVMRNRQKHRRALIPPPAFNGKPADRMTVFMLNPEKYPS